MLMYLVRRHTSRLVAPNLAFSVVQDDSRMRSVAIYSAVSIVTKLGGILEAPRSHTIVPSRREFEACRYEICYLYRVPALRKEYEA